MAVNIIRIVRYKPAIVLAFFASEGLPEPKLEYRFHNGGRKWRFDFAWLDNHFFNGGVALEVQGGIWIGGGHARGSGLRKEHEKRNEAAALGWRILYVEPRDLCTVDTVNLIKRCLGI